MSSISNVDSSVRTKVGVFNLLPHSVTITPNTRIPKFIVLTPKQASFIVPVHPSLLNITDTIPLVIEKKHEQQFKLLLILQ